MGSYDPVELAPLKAIRRFDVFAEFNRLDALKEGRPAKEPMGHGIWLAKVVASRRNRTKDDIPPSDAKKLPKHPDAPTQFKSVGDVLQTDETFDHDIVERMGADFYQKVFSPTIKAAFDDGQKYMQMRDTIRVD